MKGIYQVLIVVVMGALSHLIHSNFFSTGGGQQAGLGLILAVTAGLSAISSWAKSSREKRVADAQANAARVQLDTINRMISEGKVSQDEALAEIDEIFKGLGEKAEKNYREQLQYGVGLIESRTNRMLDQVNFQLDEAKRDASDREKTLIEEKQKSIEAIQRQNTKANEQIKSALSQRRLGGSALIAAVNKNQETFGRVVADINDSVSQRITDIGKQLAGIQRGAQHQIGQIGQMSGEQQLQLQAGLSNQLANQMMNIETGRFSARKGEERYWQNREDNLQTGAITADANADIAKAGAPSGFETFMSGLSSAADIIGPFLMSGGSFAPGQGQTVGLPSIEPTGPSFAGINVNPTDTLRANPSTDFTLGWPSLSLYKSLTGGK